MYLHCVLDEQIAESIGQVARSIKYLDFVLADLNVVVLVAIKLLVSGEVLFHYRMIFQ